MELEPGTQSIDQARDWYADITNSITAHRGNIMSAVVGGTQLPARFIGFTISEIDQFFVDQQSELSGMCIVNIIAAAEAAIRADYRDRVRRNRSDPLSQAYVSYYRSLSGQKIHRPDFDKGGVLDVLRSARVVALHTISEFRHVLGLRHWYAHGRYWLLRTKATDDPIDVHLICANLISAIDAI